MRLRFHCEQQVEVPQVAASSNEYIAAGCLCAMCVEYEKKLAAKKAVQPKEPSKEPPKNFETHGMVVLESSPQFRTIFSNSNKGLMRLAFPYVIHVVSYKVVNEKYIFPGIYGSGLRVFFRNSSMENYSDSVAPAATDYARYGVVCTPHGYDNRAVGVMRCTAVRPVNPPKEFKADHPFVFFIINRKSGNIHFCGRVANLK